MLKDPTSQPPSPQGEITKSLGNIYSQDIPTVRPGTSLYDVLERFFKYLN